MPVTAAVHAAPRAEPAGGQQLYGRPDRDPAPSPNPALSQASAEGMSLPRDEPGVGGGVLPARDEHGNVQVGVQHTCSNRHACTCACCLVDGRPYRRMLRAARTRALHR